jgi:hypothetical protein
VWVEGRWRGGGNGNGQVRDHRNNGGWSPPPQQGPTVRDHRR